MPDATLDLAHLSRQTFADRALERDVLALFDAQCVRLIGLVARGGAARDEALHTLKGAARAVGAWRVASLAQAIEAALAREERADEAETLIGELAVVIGETRAAVAARANDAP